MKPTRLSRLVPTGIIVAELPLLSQNELKTVKLAVEVLLDTKPTELDEELFQAVLDVLGTKTIGVKAFMKTKAYPVFIENQKCVHELIDRILGDVPRNKVKVVHLKRFLMDLLIGNLSTKAAVLTMDDIARDMGRIEFIFNDAFPGYLTSGLTRFLVKSLQT